MYRIAQDVYTLIKYLLICFQTKQSVQKLQIIVSSDGRFRNLREALHRCDPPCIPYLGMYLSDLSFLEEGTPSLADDGLLNFSKLRMVSTLQCNYHKSTITLRT